MSHSIAVVIPAYNEAAAIGAVVCAIPVGLPNTVVVVDNGSTDDTAARAAEAGARVVSEPRRGYGQACLAGLAVVDADVIVFLDGDFSDYPDEMPALVRPIVDGEADLVIGSRTRGISERGALLPQQRFGNALATGLIRLLFGIAYSDLGPFRAISAQALRRLDMRDTNYGWTVEMQVKAARLKLDIDEVPVSYRRRIGQSKVSGTFSGTIRAGYKIIWTILRHARFREQP